MNTKKAAILLFSALFLFSCASKDKKKPDSAAGDKPPVFKGEVMELYYPSGALLGKGGFSKTTEAGKEQVLKENEWNFYYEDGKGTLVKQKGNFKANKQEGPWISYFKSGKIQAEAVYGGGKLNGLVTTYDENGLKQSEVYYIDNKVAGEKKTYFPKTKITQKIEHYLAGKKNGISQEFYMDGKLKLSSFYKDDKLHGAWYENYPDGNKKMLGQYANGLKTGTWTVYHENGKKKMTGKFINDKMEGLWQNFTPEGNLESEGPFVDNSQKGIWKYYEKNGQLKARYTLEGGMANGTGWIYENGKLIGEGNFTGLPGNVKINGMYKEFYPNGTVKSEGEYMLSRKTKAFKEYYPTGALMAEGEYMNNKRNGLWKFYQKDGKTRDQEQSGYYMMGTLNKKLTPADF